MATMMPCDAEDEWKLVLDTLNVALKMSEKASGGPYGRVTANEWTLCGETPRVVIPDRETAQTMSVLRQLLLREIDKEVKALGAP